MYGEDREKRQEDQGENARVCAGHPKRRCVEGKCVSQVKTADTAKSQREAKASPCRCVKKREVSSQSPGVCGEVPPAVVGNLHPKVLMVYMLGTGKMHTGEEGIGRQGQFLYRYRQGSGAQPQVWEGGRRNSL